MVKFFEDIKRIMESREENLERKLRVIESLKREKEELYALGVIKRASLMNDTYSLLGVDGTSDVRKTMLGTVEYMAVAVAYYISGYEIMSMLGEVSEDFIPTVVWDESLEDNQVIMDCLRTSLELSLVGRTGGHVAYSFLDGSLFSALLNLAKGIDKARRIGGELEKKVLKYSRDAVEKLVNVLRHGKLIACPKRSKGGELVEYLRDLLGDREEFTLGDYILCAGYLDEGEYIEVPIRNRDFAFFIERLRNSGLEISDELISFLEGYRLFYMKGYGGGIHRLEVFGSYPFPAEVVAVQSLGKGNNLQIILEAETVARKVMSTFILSQSDIIESYRG